MITLFPSTIIKLEIAFTKVSMLLTVNEIAKIIIIIDRKRAFSLSIKEKNARSGIRFEFWEVAINPVNPNKNTIGIMIKNEKIRLLFKTLLSLAA